MSEPQTGNPAECDDAHPDVERGGFAYEVVVASPRWVVNGVSVFSENLVRGLRARGVSAHLLLTGSSEGDVNPMALPSDMPIHQLSVENVRGRRARQKRMIEYLKDRAPCIYIPNHDYEYSCIAPELPSDVGVVSVVHSDHSQHYAYALYLGKFCNATVAVSQTIAAHLASSDPDLTTRLRIVSHGVPAESELRRPTRDRTGPLRILYVGRLEEQVKRVFDLPRIIEGLDRHGVPATLTVVGDGSDRKKLESLSNPWVERGTIRFTGILSNREVAHELRNHDALILTSEYEGFPLAVLEAMACGCVPVVTAIRSGIPELVRDGDSGYAVDVGDIEAFVERLAGLQRDARLRERLSARAFETLHQGELTSEAMADRYIDLFDDIAKELSDGAFKRPSTRIEPFPWERPSWKDRLPPKMRRALSRAKRKMGI
jgi:glycosyltransferase involved in cell wall biosynthesis